MKTRYNIFYNNCIHLTWRYPKSTYIGNSHSKVIAWCNYFRVDAYKFKIDGLPICCVSHAPYQKKTCKYFKSKDQQTSLIEFGGS